MIPASRAAQRVPMLLLALLIPAIAGLATLGTFVLTDDNSAGAGAGDATTIEISGFDYSPKTLSVAPDTVVTVVNLDGAAHTVTSDGEGVFDTGDLGRRDEATFKVGKPGVYRYYCAIHDYMRGSIKVES